MTIDKQLIEKAEQKKLRKVIKNETKNKKSRRLPN